MVRTWQGDFADLPLDQPVTVVIGEGDARTDLPARVVSCDGDVVALRLGVTPLHGAQLSTGVRVRVVPADGRPRLAEVVLFESGPQPLIVLERPANPAITDSTRAYHRVPMHLVEALVTHVSTTGAARFRVRIVDLSGGGARLLCPRPVSPGDLFTIRLPLLGGRTAMDVRARAVWVRMVYRSWQTGVEFQGLTDPQRDLIVRSVFLEELRWRRVH